MNKFADWFTNERQQKFFTVLMWLNIMGAFLYFIAAQYVWMGFAVLAAMLCNWYTRPDKYITND